ncbi:MULTISPECIES: AraC family transcriptional regulator [Micrococcales]|uniref:Helix-turn-helix transcriptional regulator n=3 Tax=Micrococcales TaxID=85006 RepID=A0AAJ5VAU3_MICMQ|nr:MULTISPECIES: AraC family transcriptional regulator [Micrococcales]AMG82892.1 hypothetical protein AXH82_05475 [Microbacterium sp. PAMC 28756]EXJ51241.1 hypothetical protein AS96_10505 [Microbacterium sp. MRS-1]RBO70824.1 AraC family transcriptional regulator [Microbacterium sp. H6]MDR6268468.1 AraC-like DNA-binding protein [Arthrobacter russicus]WEF20833.1 helix-turn-helix transcriptional regulator [Microbacterium liquefaciens]
MAVEVARTLPSSRAIFRQTKILNVLEGTCEIATADGVFTLRPGTSFALGSGRWCQIRPAPSVRMWAVYADDEFWLSQMSWFFPDRSRVLAGIHPHEWGGIPLLIEPGVEALRQIEPLWRQMSILSDGSHPPEVVATRTVELLARWVGMVLPTFLSAENGQRDTQPPWRPIDGRLTDPAVIGHIGDTVRMLRTRMAEPWTVGALAREASLSRTHLTRMFLLHTGAPPMRFLTEIRLTEFTRLIEETDLSVGRAAAASGWRDPRVASNWFQRRFGVTPTQYRLTPHPSLEELCARRVIEDESVG